MSDPNIVVPVAAMITAVIITLSVVSMVQYAKYKVKIEQIKADTAFKIEEMKAKYQSEAEKQA